MVTMVTEKRVLNYKEAKKEYDGHWLLLDMRDFPPADDMGYVVAYGDGTPEDRDALRRINFDKYHGDALLMKGWVQKDDIHYCRIVEAL